MSPQTCLVCRRGDDDEHLLLCDGCDRGCHLYCHRPRMTEVPEGDWFCSVCVARVGLWGRWVIQEGSQALLGSLSPGEVLEKSLVAKKDCGLPHETPILILGRDPDGLYGISVLLGGISFPRKDSYLQEGP